MPVVTTAGPNTLVGLATVAAGVDRSELVARLIPAYVGLLKQLKVHVFWHDSPCLARAACGDDDEIVMLPTASSANHLLTAGAPSACLLSTAEIPKLSHLAAAGGKPTTSHCLHVL